MEHQIALDTLKLAKTVLAKDWVSIFDRLKKGQKIQVAFKSIMGFGGRGDGDYHEWIVGRKSAGRRHNFERISLIPPDDPNYKPDKRRDIMLWKKPDWEGNMAVSASFGDMAVTLVGIKP